MTDKSNPVTPNEGGSNGTRATNQNNPSASKKAETNPPADESKTGKGRVSKIVALLVEKGKHKGGKLTWSELEKITGLTTDADEIDEILEICQREGIEIIDDDTEPDYPDDDAGETGEDGLPAETTQLDGVDLQVENTDVTPEDDVEPAVKSENVDINIADNVSIDDPVRMYLKEIGRVC